MCGGRGEGQDRDVLGVGVAGNEGAATQGGDRAYGGNVSAVIEAIALEADRQEALDWLLQRAPPVDDEAFEAFMREMAGPKRRRARRVA